MLYLGRAWTSPTLIMTTSPAHGIMVCTYVSMSVCIIYPAFVAPWFLRSVYSLKCSMYSVYWLAHMCDLQLHALNWTARTIGATRACREDYRWRQVGECADIWYKHINLLRQWSCSCPATCQCRRLCESKMTDELTALPFCDVHIDNGATLNLLRCLCIIVDVETYRLTVVAFLFRVVMAQKIYCFESSEQLNIVPYMSSLFISYVFTDKSTWHMTRQFS